MRSRILLFDLHGKFEDDDVAIFLLIPTSQEPPKAGARGDILQAGMLKILMVHVIFHKFSSAKKHSNNEDFQVWRLFRAGIIG